MSTIVSYFQPGRSELSFAASLEINSLKLSSSVLTMDIDRNTSPSVSIAAMKVILGVITLSVMELVCPRRRHFFWR